MIARAKKTDTGKLIFPEDAPQTFTKGDFVCPYCEVPLTPVMPEDESKASFWRIYPGQEHLLGYCRTISEKEGLVHSAAATKEAKFFLNDKRPEKGYPYAEASSAADLLGSEPETLTGNAADDLFGSDEEEEHSDEVQAPSGSEAEGLITAAAELDESLVGQSVIIHHAPEREPRVSAETVVSQLSQLYDENFHESPLSTPMFGKTRGDYQIVP